MSRAAAYLAGYWLGCGGKCQGSSCNEPLALLFGQDKDLGRVEDALNDAGWEYKLYLLQRPTMAFEVVCQELYWFLFEQGLWSGELLDKVCSGWSDLEKVELVKGLFDADGNLHKERKTGTVRIGLTNTDGPQIEAMGRLLEAFGVRMSIYHCRDRRGSFQIEVWQGSVQDFLRLFPLQSHQMARLER